MLLTYTILIIVIVYFIFFAPKFYNIIRKDYAPVITTDQEIINRIIKESEIKEGLNIYELGCGRANFLRAVEESTPRTKLIGAENLLGIYLMAWLKLKLLRSRIRLLKKNIFKLNLNDADIIYCYLNNSAMEKLGEIFRRNCKTGAQIVSLSFPMPEFEPEKTLEVKNKKLYFYKV